MRRLYRMGLCLAVAASGCYYDKLPDMYPTLNTDAATCAPGEVSFSRDIMPLMTVHCNTPTCHNSLDRGGDIVLDNYTELLTSAQDGSLLGSVRLEPGYSPMPQGAAPLDPCDIAKLEIWINAGTPEN